MPEGPEVRRQADALDAALSGRPLRHVAARTRAAKAWLESHPGAFEGRPVGRVYSHGKHLVGEVEGGLYFASHLLMWGRWHVVAPDDPLALEKDRRERARLTTDEAVAVLLSAPVFHVGQGDPRADVPWLGGLGPDVLPYAGPADFDADAFHTRLFSGAHAERPVGAVLLDQTLLAGLGNYLRAEVLFLCRLDPWKGVADLSDADVACLDRTIPAVAAQAYREEGQTLSPEAAARVVAEPRLRYGAARPWNARHWVFRRTNLPCLVCGDTVRQLRQPVRVPGEGEEAKERIVYFCPTCQGTTVPLPPVRRKRKEAPDG